MKRQTLILLVLVFFLFSIPVLAEEANYQDNAAMYGAAIKANGSLQLEVLHLNLDELNAILGSGGFAPLSQNMVVFGGRGLVGVKQGSRFGGYGFGGSVYSSKGGKKASLGIGYGGFLYEKAVYVNQKNDIALGAMIGGGKATLKLIHNSPENVGDAVTGDGGADYFSKGFLVIEPRVTWHHQLGTFVGFDLAAGYIFTYDFNTPWKVFDSTVDGPLRNFSTPSLTVGFTVGF